jgi:hypothetical protein
MAIICGPITTTINYSNQLICGHLVKVASIEPYYQTIEVMIDNQQIIPGIGNVAVSIIPNFTTRAVISLINKNVSAGTANISFAIESIEVPPPPIEVSTHMVQLEMSPNPYIGYLEQNIVSISAQVADALPFTPNVQYIRTELDTSGKYMNVYVKYIGPAILSMDGYYNVYSLGIMDDINNFAMAIIPILIAIASILITAAIILAGGFTLPVIAVALAAGGLVFILGYVSYDLIAKLQVAAKVIDNQQAFIQPTIEKDQGKKALDDAFEKSAKSKEDCLTLLKGYQEKDKIYINSLSAKLTKLQLTDMKGAYDICTNNLIENFKADKISCDTARAGFSPCENVLYAGTGEQFNKNYDPNAAFEEKCTTDCLICEPITNKCILSKGTATLIGIGLLGFLYFSTKPKETIVIRGG